MTAFTSKGRRVRELGGHAAVGADGACGQPQIVPSQICACAICADVRFDTLRSRRRPAA